MGTSPDEIIQTKVSFVGADAGRGAFAGIHYYGYLDTDETIAPVGATVIFGFRIQSFVTRANIAVINHDNQARLLGIFDQLGRRLP